MLDLVREVYYRVKREGCFYPLNKEKAFQGLGDGTLVFSKYEFKSNPNRQVITLVDQEKLLAPGPGISVDEFRSVYLGASPVNNTIDHLMVPVKLDTSKFNEALQRASDLIDKAPAPKEKTMTKEEYVLKRALKEAEENLQVLKHNMENFTEAVSAASVRLFLHSDTTEGRLTSLKEAVAESHPWVKLGPLQKDEDGDLFVTVDVQ